MKDYKKLRLRDDGELFRFYFHPPPSTSCSDAFVRSLRATSFPSIHLLECVASRHQYRQRADSLSPCFPSFLPFLPSSPCVLCKLGRSRCRNLHHHRPQGYVLLLQTVSRRRGSEGGNTSPLVVLLWASLAPPAPPLPARLLREGCEHTPAISQIADILFPYVLSHTDSTGAVVRFQPSSRPSRSLLELLS